MSDFLNAGDPDCFLGMKVKEKASYFPDHVPCPLCKGYGGWHLKVNAYGEGKHFDCVCHHCNGWGYVDPKYADHVHDYVYWDEAKTNKFRKAKGLPPAKFTYGNCCHNAVCKVCGAYAFYDSSD